MNDVRSFLGSALGFVGTVSAVAGGIVLISYEISAWGFWGMLLSFVVAPVTATLGPAYFALAHSWIWAAVLLYCVALPATLTSVLAEP